MESNVNMGRSLNQDDINKVIWRACDTFRGKIDSSEYKDYILTMLFIKYISDVWQDHFEQYQNRYGGDETRIRRRLDRERFVLPSGCTFYDLYQKRNANNLGEEINKVMEAIEDANKAKLENVFRNIDFNSEAKLGYTKERNKILKELLEDFNDPRLDLRPSVIGDHDIIGDVYQFLIEKFASDAGKKGGEFYTPKEVSRLIAMLVEPKEGEKICDPTCGSGSLLIRTALRIESGNFSLYGQELNGGTWSLCRMNMFLHGMDGARIERGDTLNNPLLVENGQLMKFDIVVANPPFSLDKWGQENAHSDQYNRFHRGIPPKSRGDYAFITHMVETINEYGRVGVVVPHGVLFRGGAEGKIRQKLIDENVLDAVIGLPANLFFGTGIPAAILIFKKSRTTKDVLFIDASREFEQGKKQNKLRPQDIQKIYDTYQQRKFVDKYAYVASMDEIRENEYNLNIPRYVDTFEPEPEVDIAAVQREIEEIEGELAKVREEMSKYLEELSLLSN